MKLKSLLCLAVLCLLHGTCTDLYAGEKEQEQTQANTIFALLPDELLPVVASVSDCKTICTLKLLCKRFNQHIDYKDLHPHAIEREDYDMCTHGLVRYAQTNDDQLNFEALLKNNYDQRMNDIKILLDDDEEQNPSVQELMDVYRVGLTWCSLEKFSSVDNLKRIMPIIDPNMQTGSKDATLLHLACKGGNVELVKLLLGDKRTDLDMLDMDGWPPLYYACCNDDQEIVKLLLADKRRINVNIKLYMGWNLFDSIDGVDEDSEGNQYMTCRSEEIKQLLVSHGTQHSWWHYLTLPKPPTPTSLSITGTVVAGTIWLGKSLVGIITAFY